MIVNRFISTFTQFGFGTAVIQSQEINDGQISAIFYIQTLFNLLLFILTFLFSDLISVFFNEPRLSLIIKAMGFILFIRSFNFPFTLMRKQMNFKDFSIIQIFSMIFGNIIAIIMAFSNYGVWSLVFRLLIINLSNSILGFYVSKWLPKKPDFNNLKQFFKFGTNLLGSNLFKFFNQNLVGLLTSKFLGAEIMGLFNIAYNLAIVPSKQLNSVLTNVLTSGYSRLQYEIKKFRDNYISAFRFTSILFLPIMILLHTTSYSLISIVYGEKWIGSSELLELLAIAGIFMGLNQISRSAIIAKGKTVIIFNSSVLYTLFCIPVMYFLMPNYGINGLIFGFIVGAFIEWLYLSYKFNIILEDRIAIFKSLKTAFLIAIFAYPPIIFVNYFNHSEIFQILINLSIIIASTSITILLFEKDIKDKIKFLIRNFTFRKI